MNIWFSAEMENPEILLCDSILGLRFLGQSLFEINDEVEFAASQDRDEFYPENLDRLIIRKSELPEYKDQLKISLFPRDLIIEGNQRALENLGNSILGNFDEKTDEQFHMHLDHIGEGGLVGPTNCNLIIKREH